MFGPAAAYSYEGSDTTLGTDDAKNVTATTISTSVMSIPTFCGSVEIIRRQKQQSKCARIRSWLGCDESLGCSWVTFGKAAVLLFIVVLSTVLGVVISYYCFDQVEAYSFVMRDEKLTHVEGVLLYSDNARFYTPQHGHINKVETVLDFKTRVVTNIDATGQACFTELLPEEDIYSLEVLRKSLQHIHDKKGGMLTQEVAPVSQIRTAVPLTSNIAELGLYSSEKCKRLKYPIYRLIRQFSANNNADRCKKSCFPHFTVTTDVVLPEIPLIYFLKLIYVECVSFPPCRNQTNTS